MGPSSEPKRARVGHSDHFIAENLSLKLTSPELYEVNHNDLKRAFQAGMKEHACSCSFYMCLLYMCSRVRVFACICVRVLSSLVLTRKPLVVCSGK